MAVIVRYPTEFGSHVKLYLAVGLGLFLVFVLVFVLTCMVLFNNVWSCIMLLVTKLHKNLIHHLITIARCATLSCYDTLYTLAYIT